MAFFELVRTEVLKRIESLLVPYCIFCLAWKMFFGGVCALSAVRHGQPFVAGFGDFSPVDIFGLNPRFPPLYYEMWFVRSLFIFVLLSGVIAWAIQKVKWFVFLGMTALAYVFRRLYADEFLVFIFFHYFALAYFILGCTLRMYPLTLKIPSSFGIDARGLARYTFLVYCLPSFYLAIFRLVVTKRGDSCAVLIGQCLFGYFASVASAWMLAAFYPKGFRVLSGGR